MKFEPIFKLAQNPVFINDLIFKSVYKDMGTVTTIQNGKWELFLPKVMLDKISEEKYNEVLSGLDLKEFEQECLKVGEKVTELGKKELANLSNEEFVGVIDELFEVGGYLFKLYKQTEFFNFIKVEKELQEFIDGKTSFEDVLSGKVDLSPWPDDKRKLAEHIINIQHLKFKLRKIMNESWMGPDAMIGKMLEQLAIRTKREDAVNMTVEEIKDCLKGKEVRDVSERYICSYIEWDKEKNILKIYSGEEAKSKISELNKEVPENEVVGTVACRGLVKGRVKVIPTSLNPKEYLSKMEKGDILVSDTTGPEMVIAMQKASAIVTDEGGMMSHAALVSREFGIPCVVGTKYATEVFKDGDLIEVDAEKGIVRKVSE